MRIIRSIQEMQVEALRLKREELSIGFVPTMGYLHEGHLSLVRIARSRADCTVVSLFVNPTQFGEDEDLARYPRDPERDERLCKEERVDILFQPEAEAMYEPEATVFVDENNLTRAYEGAERSGHFRGVLTVVAKLFNIVQPDLAVFGRKDAQQLAAVRRLVRDLNMPVEIVPGDIVREVDGLAMSSRNVYLDAGQREQARCLRQALAEAERMATAGERNADRIREAMAAVISKADLARPDYIDVVNEQRFVPVQTMDGPCLALLAVRFGETRLLDNARLMPPR